MQAMMIGTLFEQEEIDQKKNFHNMVARDEKGRKRWEGAFTGGFTAGYKNTVGSKEGWTPSTFVSSRSQRAQQKKQNIADYMDEEDLGKTIAGETLTAKNEYDTMGDKSSEILQKDLGKSILGIAPKELIVASRNSIGYEILKKMNSKKDKELQKPKQIFKKKYGMQLPPGLTFGTASTNNSKKEFVSEYASEQEIPQFKENFHGLGYSDTQHDIDVYENVFNKIINKYKNVDKDQEDQDDIQAKKDKNRIMMKGSNYDYIDDDDEEISYSKSNNNYNFEIDTFEAVDDKKLEKAKFIAKREALEDFSKEDKPLRLMNRFMSKLEVPKDYDPFKKVKEYMANKSNKPEVIPHPRYRTDMDPAKRAQMLGEEIKFEPNKALEESKQILDSKIQNISQDVRERIIGVKKFVKGSTQELQGITNLPFSENPDKQKRYLEFVNQKEGHGTGPTYTGQYNLEQIKNEKDEFERFYKLYKTTAKSGADMANASIQQEDLLKKIEDLQNQINMNKKRRRVENWIPDKVLCKRFNVPTPYNKKAPPEPETKKDKFYDEILPMFLSQKGRGEKLIIKPRSIEQKDDTDLSQLQFKSNKFVAGGYEKPGETQEANKKAVEEEEEEVVVEEGEKPIERPPFELFKSIFGDEEEEEEN